MTASLKRLLPLFLGLSAIGCSGNLGGSYWMPSFSNSTQSGPGSEMVDIKQDFGVATQSGVFTADIWGQLGSQRFKAGYWKITGSGVTTNRGRDIDFANHTYTDGTPVAASMNLSMISAIWEPGVINKPKFRFSLALGAELVQFNFIADDGALGPGEGVVAIPTSSMDFIGIGFMPVPVIGGGFDLEFNHWLGLTGNGLYFDTGWVGNLGLGGSASFYGAEGGLYIGDRDKHHARVFVGYRYLHAEYNYTDESGNSTLGGFIANLSYVF